MFQLPDRAPIPYTEMRQPFNLLRLSGATVFAVASVLVAVFESDPAPLWVLIPAAAVFVDAAVRLRVKSTPLPALIVDASAMFTAIALRGPSLTTGAVALCYLLVAASLLLPMLDAIAIVAYGGVLWVAIGLWGDGFASGPVGAIGRAGFARGFDRIMVGVVLVAVASIMLRAVRSLLDAQDRQSEALAQERRAVELKNEFVSMVSHELRTPLTGIAGFTDTLESNWRELPARDVDEFLAIMHTETAHLANLVEDILVIPRLEAGQLRLDPVPVDLAAVARSVATMVFPDDSGCAVDLPAGVTVMADATRLRQILRNLIENAGKYGGDQILVEGELSEPGVFTVSVSDNGNGIPDADRDRIFEHFEQLSSGDGRLQQGVGLGLPIARRLARAMGGDLWYEDRFPVGSKFRFTVRLAGQMPENRGLRTDAPTVSLEP